MKRRTHEQYIKELSSSHPNIIPLEKYAGINTKILHKHECGYEWPVTPKTLLRGHGCPKCGNALKKTDAEYKNELKENNIINLEPYVNAHTKILHKCLKCDYQWYKKPNAKSGCHQCSGNVRKDTEYHNNEIIDLPITCLEYNGARNGKYKCNDCDFEYSARPNDVLNGYGKCPVCNRSELNTETFILKAINVHGDLYDYSLVDYKGHHKIDIICKKHGIFKQGPSMHLSGQGCPRCRFRSHSNIAIHWLDSLNNSNIQHNGNSKEHIIYLPKNRKNYDIDWAKIPNKYRFHVDGFDKTTNTVYEFLGDAYHGNLNRYSKDEKCHTHKKDKTARELNDEWLERKNLLEQMGYKVVYIWESDYKQQIINRNMENR